MIARWIRRGLAALLGLILLLLLLVVGALLALDIPGNAAGMAAKSICSATFVAGRPWQDLLAQEVVPASPALAPISIRVDEAGRSVTARFAGLFARQARLLPERGCVLAADAAGASTPPVQAAKADTAQPWPVGEVALPPDQWGAGVDSKALQQLAQSAFVGAGDPQAANTRGIAIIHKGRA
ncbi:MAG: hypothetical protein ABIN37_16520, partial [Burkholderiaceae bacterium]